MDRREFLSMSAKLAAMAGAASLGLKNNIFSSDAAYDLAAVKNGTPVKMLDSAMKALGGMDKFVKKGGTVLVKPNIGWDVTPELAANTNPALVAGVVKHCLDAGASKVYVMDHTCDGWKSSYKTSGIEKAARDAGAAVVTGNSKGSYQQEDIKGAKTLKRALVHELMISCDSVINVPILKSHGSTGLTLGMKNLMGVVWDRGWWHMSGLHQCIADFAAYRKPDLTIIDAFRIMKKNGPRGVSEADVTEARSLVASPDMVAADAAAAALFGAKPENIDYIKIAAQKGLGTMDLSKLRISRQVM